MRWLAVFFLLSASVLADEATVAWDHPSDVLKYRLYMDGAPLSEHSEKTAVITLPPAGGTLAVTAFSSEAESAKSVPISIPAAPTGVTVTIIFGSP